MTRNRPIDYIERPLASGIDVDNLKELGEIVSAVFSFQHEHRPEPPQRSAPAKKWAEFFLANDISENLYKKTTSSSTFQYYVERPDEFRELYGYVEKSKGLTLLVSQAGAGKSTLLGRLKSEFDQALGSSKDPFEQSPLFVRLDFMKTNDVLHEASAFLVGQSNVDEALLTLRRRYVYRHLIDILECDHAKTLDAFQAWLIRGAPCGEALRAWLAESYTLDETEEMVSAIRLQVNLEGKNELDAMIDGADINDLLTFLDGRFRVVIAFDNVDRWPYKFQSLILQLALDLGAKARIVLSIRSSNIERLELPGQDANETNEVVLSPMSQAEFATDVFVTRARALDRLRNGHVTFDLAVKYYQSKEGFQNIAESSIRGHLREKLQDSRSYLENMLTSIALSATARRQALRDRRSYVDDEQSRLYTETLEFLQAMNLGKFSLIVSDLVGILKTTWVEEQIFHFNNNSLRHALLFYGDWIKSLIVGDDPAFWYPTLLSINQTGSYTVNKRPTINYVYKKMLVRDPGGNEPNSRPLLSLFYKSESGIVAPLLRILEGLSACVADGKNRYWDSKAVTLGSLEDHFLMRFGAKERDRKRILRDELYSGLEELQRMETNGHLGLVWCTDVIGDQLLTFDRMTPAHQFILTPAGYYVIDVLLQKREFAFWCFVHTEGLNWGSQAVETSPKKYPFGYLQSCSEDFRIRAVQSAFARYLRRLFSDELAQVRKAGGDMTTYLERHLYVRLLSSLSSNIGESEIFQREIEQRDTNGAYHGFRRDLQDMSAHFIAAAKAA